MIDGDLALQKRDVLICCFGYATEAEVRTRYHLDVMEYIRVCYTWEALLIDWKTTSCGKPNNSHYPPHLRCRDLIMTSLE